MNLVNWLSIVESSLVIIGNSPSDVSVPNLGHFKYYVLFVDDFSHVLDLFNEKKSEVFSKFLLFVNEIRTQHSAIIKVFRSDNAKEYTSRVVNTRVSNHDIIHESSCAYSPQQNGVAERKHRHLLEVTRCLMLHMPVPKYLCMFLNQ